MPGAAPLGRLICIGQQTDFQNATLVQLPTRKQVYSWLQSFHNCSKCALRYTSSKAPRVSPQRTNARISIPAVRSLYTFIRTPRGTWNLSTVVLPPDHFK
ncbi:hypothetical protein M404DRAFT_748460 [Pisolithus tinctorius Marx 270]|uniref:Uncharacterized protein n=1 Tax=Pisolithus tinctorius Marx 270 TaxID=870435 RepID=A0A0C3PTT7_PISTI|nr:hypothetical protein M404DRAFT_748460 [Pisolithus tinctorius Marx 270]